ncbi:hypothetical protein ABZX04_38470, partial [Streptomyces rochei]
MAERAHPASEPAAGPVVSGRASAAAEACAGGFAGALGADAVSAGAGESAGRARRTLQEMAPGYERQPVLTLYRPVMADDA